MDRDDSEDGKAPNMNVARKLDYAIRHLGLIVERTEKVLDELAGISVKVRAPKPPPPEGPAPAVHNLQLDPAMKGRFLLSFDGGQAVALPPALAHLAAILASGETESADEFVSWKSFDLLSELLEKRLGRGFNHHLVSQLLHRLRAALKAADLDPRLIESSRRGGARLRLKRRASGVGAG